MGGRHSCGMSKSCPGRVSWGIIAWCLSFPFYFCRTVLGFGSFSYPWINNPLGGAEPGCLPQLTALCALPLGQTEFQILILASKVLWCCLTSPSHLITESFLLVSVSPVKVVLLASGLSCFLETQSLLRECLVWQPLPGFHCFSGLPNSFLNTGEVIRKTFDPRKPNLLHPAYSYSTPLLSDHRIASVLSCYRLRSCMSQLEYNR